MLGTSITSPMRKAGEAKSESLSRLSYQSLDIIAFIEVNFCLSIFISIFLSRWIRSESIIIKLLLSRKLNKFIILK